MDRGVTTPEMLGNVASNFPCFTDSMQQLLTSYGATVSKARHEKTLPVYESQFT
jgi:hypothetical protein